MGNELGKMVRERMRELGFTYERTSKLAAITKDYLHKIIRGQRKPREAILLRLSDALKLDWEKVLLATCQDKLPEEMRGWTLSVEFQKPCACQAAVNRFALLIKRAVALPARIGRALRLMRRRHFRQIERRTKTMQGKTLLAVLVSVFMAVTVAVLNSEAMAAGKELVIADFDSGDKPNNLGGDFGTWDKDPEDETQSVQLKFEPEDALGDPAGYSIRLDYDVDSPNPAYNGFWTKLNGEDATAYNTLSFYIKGDQQAGFTKRLKVELKDMSNRPSAYVVSGITNEWQKVSVRFEKFRKVTDWSRMNEFVVVFDDMNSRPKTGAIYIDQIALSKE